MRRPCRYRGKEHSRQREKPVQRPWGRNKLGVFKGQQGGQCVWRGGEEGRSRRWRWSVVCGGLVTCVRGTCPQRKRPAGGVWTSQELLARKQLHRWFLVYVCTPQEGEEVTCNLWLAHLIGKGNALPAKIIR